MTNKHGVDDLMKKVVEMREAESKRIRLEDINISPTETIVGATALAERLAPRRETVNHPDHYGGDTIYETIKVLKAWLTREQYVGFLLGNAIKYLSRAGKKGSAAEDLRKARWYIEKLIEDIEGEGK